MFQDRAAENQNLGHTLVGYAYFYCIFVQFMQFPAQFLG